MRKHDQPDDSLSSEEEAEMHAFRRIASALERGDVDELAAALHEMPDPAGLAPGSYTVTGHVSQGSKPYQQASCSSNFTVREFEPPTLSCSAPRWRCWAARIRRS